MIDKEALSPLFVFTQFHQYLVGKRFKIITDHKPLIRLLDSVKKVLETFTMIHYPYWMLRWSLILAGFDYTLEYEDKDNKTCS